MFKRLHRLIRNFFGFSHGEAKGFLLLLWLLLALSLAYLMYKQLPEEGYTTFAEDRALLDSLIQQMERQETRPDPPGRQPFRTAEAPEPLLFPFDPNGLSVDSLRLLGLPQWLAARIYKYRQKGGSFREKEDLRKIYGLPDSTYLRLEPYIRIENLAQKNPKPQREESRQPPWKKYPSADSRAGREIFPLDINKSDSLSLQALRGIGPVLSGRIVRFRQKLGGFVSLEQLYEVWGLDSMVVAGMMEKAFVQEDFQPVPVSINSAGEEELAAHPYIGFKQARLLYAYRQQHGPFLSANDLLKIHTLDSVFVDKIAPYIALE